jgi:predicted acyl esterase
VQIVVVRRSALAALMTVALLAAGCTSDDTSGGTTSTTSAGASVGSGDMVGGAGTNQIWVRTEPNAEIILYGPDGEPVPVQRLQEDGEVVLEDRRATDANGAAVLRFLEPGEGYVVKLADDESITTERLTVTSPDEHPEPELYEQQEIGEGYGYLTVRDGIELAINVTLPGPIDEGPYPTVVEYSGYDQANPNPSLVTISKTLAGQLGFATVGVNLRGSGCSGGSLLLWEDAAATDGYDIIETIAAQDWVDGDVGMVGISYPASAMLYAASTRPPSLAAIAPMAAYDDGFRALLWPGGIQNEGFARRWVQERYAEAQDPNPSEWVQQRIAEGDETCADNMALRGQNVDLGQMIDVLPYFPEINDLGDQFAPRTFVDQIEVPTYLVATWQDEQVGGHAPSMIDDFTGVDDGYFTLLNGYHAEGLANASILQGWLEFLQLYVAKEVPDTTALAGLANVVTGQVIGDSAAGNEQPALEERFDPEMTYDEALAEYRERPRVRVLLDSGGSTRAPAGVPVADIEHDFESFPPANVAPTTWYLGADGTLTSEAPAAADDADGTIDAYTSDPSVRPKVSLVEDQDPWWKLPEYDWAQPVRGSALAYETAELTDDTTMIGSGSADLWIRSSEADTDLQVTLTEVRPDGKETYVQSGWLRASKRALDEELATELQPILSQREGDAADLPEGEFVPVRVEIYPFAHAFRAGSKVRITISAPGGDLPVWSFVTLDGTQRNEIARSAGRPSAVVLPVVPGLTIPTELPPCPGLRGQPCRPYQPFANR